MSWGLERKELALHEFASVPGVQESMCDVMLNMQKLNILALPVNKELLAMSRSMDGDEPERWCWATRLCGPGAVQARDLDIMDSPSHMERPVRIAEPGHHICRLTSASMIELEVMAVCCSQAEWDMSPACAKFQNKLRHSGWLMVPAIFSPVMKVNYVVKGTGSEGQPEDGEDESVQLEVWSRVSERPANLVRTAVASLFAALTARGEAPEASAAASGTEQEHAPPDRRPTESKGPDAGSPWDFLSDPNLGATPLPQPSDDSGRAAGATATEEDGLRDLIRHRSASLEAGYVPEQLDTGFNKLS